MSAAEVTAMQQLETRIVSERSPFVVFTKGQVQITLNEYVYAPTTHTIRVPTSSRPHAFLSMLCRPRANLICRINWNWRLTSFRGYNMAAGAAETAGAAAGRAAVGAGRPQA